MSDTIIRVENLGKKYIIGHQQEGHSRYVALRDVIADGVKSFVNRFTNPKSQLPRNKEEFWALKDVSFEVKRGECVGIIGRNGAGKSTLLKILSRITEPTTGRVELGGRVASLLEVGTGFHPELTGRENIYLNGAILGMSKAEIKRKFDEIVDFAEVEKFLDTPVKHYSSGMYVRLAFAVAAHLEPEILIVDEVLAVGDIEFQKKCLGKMGDVASKEGRTVLFVSHNMGTILNLCQKGILLKNGQLVVYSTAKESVHQYLSVYAGQNSGVFDRAPTTQEAFLIERVEIFNEKMEHENNFDYNEKIYLLITTKAHSQEPFGINLRIKNSKQELIAHANSWINSDGNESKSYQFDPGDKILIEIPEIKLVQDTYYVDIICNIWKSYHVENWWDTVNFKITSCQPKGFGFSIEDSHQLGSIILDNVQFKKLPSC